ncbi:MAG: hypothetical protein CSA10_01375, partial [Cardiobacteriales bacterium]
MTKRKKIRARKQGKNRVITRILGAILILFIMSILIFVGIKFISVDRNQRRVVNNNRGADTTVTNTDGRKSDAGQTTGEPSAKYSFYNELKQRSAEVEAQVNMRIEENNNKAKVTEGNNYRIQVG